MHSKVTYCGPGPTASHETSYKITKNKQKTTTWDGDEAQAERNRHFIILTKNVTNEIHKVRNTYLYIIYLFQVM